MAFAGAAPASAVFFCTYEYSKNRLGDCVSCNNSPEMKFVCTLIGASVMGELCASVVRVPTDLMKQRLQTGYNSSFALPITGNIFLASFQATAMRDICHSSLQYPMYEYFKLAATKWFALERIDDLPVMVAASCGSVAGLISATLTTPFDIMKTRLNLRAPTQHDSQLRRWDTLALFREEAQKIFQKRGLRGFFAGAVFRAAWMGLGGFVFLGSFEMAKTRILTVALPPSDPCSPHTFELPAISSFFSSLLAAGNHNTVQGLEQSVLNRSTSSPVWVSFSAGLFAGLAVDVPLHPLDTVKTRLQAPCSFRAAGGFRGIWSGFSAVLLMSAPGSATFFVVYEQTRQLLRASSSTNPLPVRLSAVSSDAIAACIADAFACLMRVPCEVIKQRMQTRAVTGAPASIACNIRAVRSAGLIGLFNGFGATICREVPFALIQMPLFERLKLAHPLAQSARFRYDQHAGLVGMSCGAVAGAVAGCLTTPLDTAKTRIMLNTQMYAQSGLLRTLRSVLAESGARELFSGVLPRTLHCCAGGALWLGAFEWSKQALNPGMFH